MNKKNVCVCLLLLIASMYIILLFDATTTTFTYHHHSTQKHVSPFLLPESIITHDDDDDDDNDNTQINTSPQPYLSEQQQQQQQTNKESLDIKWATATLVTLSSGKTRTSNSITYTHQAVLLANQLSKRYPTIPLLAIVAIGQLDETDSSMLLSAGYTLRWKKPVVPVFTFDLERSIAPVYFDQYMKFWLWNETEFDRIVYLDSDTFFTNISLIDFALFFDSVHEDGVVACPTPWSKVTLTNKRTPITWNGGFFILKPSETRFIHFMESSEPPRHFATHYDGNFGWFDASEMGAFMRDLPNFTTPAPLWQYCADTQICCVIDKCETKFDMPKQKGLMVHGMKPNGLVTTGLPLTEIFNYQRFDVFQSWGYDAECMLLHFYAPLVQLYIQFGLLNV